MHSYNSVYQVSEEWHSQEEDFDSNQSTTLDSSLDREIREPSSNSIQIHYIHLDANTLGKGINPPPMGKADQVL